MKTLYTIEDRVKIILTRDKKSRDDDMLLYLKVCNDYLKDVGAMTFAEVMTQYRFLGLPNLKSVGRTRRKLQATYPELAGNLRVRQLRADREQAYRDYAKE